MNERDDASDLARARRHTGAVDLILVGKRTSYLTGDELVEEIHRTNFVTENALVEERDEAELRTESCELKDDFIAVAMARGVVFNRISISGRGTGRFSSLDPGTYYACLDFVEGPEFEEGRWLVRYIDAKGNVRSYSFEVQVKSVIDFHPDIDDMKTHTFPSVGSHGIGHREAAARLGLGFGQSLGTDDWGVSCSNWRPIGTNQDGTVMCMADCVCTGRAFLVA